MTALEKFLMVIYILIFNCCIATLFFLIPDHPIDAAIAFFIAACVPFLSMTLEDKIKIKEKS